MGPSRWSEHLVKVPLVDRVPVPLSLAPVGGSCQANLGRSVTQRTQENMTPREESYFGTNARPYPPLTLTLTLTLPSGAAWGHLGTAADLHWVDVAGVIMDKVSCCSWHQRSMRTTRVATRLHWYSLHSLTCNLHTWTDSGCPTESQCHLVVVFSTTSS